MTITDIAAQILIDLGVASGTSIENDWPVFIAVELEEPPRCITLYYQGGTVKSANDMQTGEHIEYRTPSMLVRVRAPDYDEAMAKSRQIEREWNRSEPWETGDPLTSIDMVRLVFDSNHIGRDPQNRHLVLTSWEFMTTHRIAEIGS